jgi:hypothetical protein
MKNHINTRDNSYVNATEFDITAIEAEEPKQQEKYSLVDWRGGKLVQDNSQATPLFCDKDGMWLRSKKPMTPMKEEEARAFLEFLVREDRRMSRKWRMPGNQNH